MAGPWKWNQFDVFDKLKNDDEISLQTRLSKIENRFDALEKKILDRFSIIENRINSCEDDLRNLVNEGLTKLVESIVNSNLNEHFKRKDEEREIEKQVIKSNYSTLEEQIQTIDL